MESTKGRQSDSEDEGESEEEEADEEAEGSEREVAEGSERAEVREDVEDAGSSEHEEEEPDGSAKLWSEEQANKIRASTESQSRSPSPVGQLASKVERTLSVNGSKEMRDKAAIDAYKRRAREKQKHHSRRGTERIGRAKGSKAKQDNRVKLDKDGLWD
jgi:RIO kinase 2